MRAPSKHPKRQRLAPPYDRAFGRDLRWMEREHGQVPVEVQRTWRHRLPGLLFAAALVTLVLIDSRLSLVAGVLLTGAGSLWSALRLTPETYDRVLGGAGGPGWWIGWLLSRLPYAAAKVSFVALSFGILALGVAGLVVG
jgi:hypothetical protein